MIPYGHSIVGKVYYHSSLDTPSYGCTPENVPNITNPPKVDSSPIVILDRGSECDFVTQVRNVETNGGHVALIINNSTEEDISSIVMADTGRGMEVSIPGVIISKKDGDVIKQFLKNNNQITPIFEVEFKMEKANVVQYDLWYSPDQSEVYKLLGDFFIYQSTLKKHATLNVHIVTYPHSDYNPTKPEPVSISNCLSGGKYCIRNPQINDVKGEDVLKEAIRQKCIYNNVYGKGEPEQFWNYMYIFYIDCFSMSLFTTECSLRTMQNSKISLNEIAQCYTNSFGVSNAKSSEKGYELIFPNSLLENELIQRREWHIDRVPSLFVNNRLFLSSWKGEYLFEAICAGLIKKPDYCFIDGYFAKERGYSTGSIIGIILLIIAINAVIFYFCIRQIRKMVRDQLSSSNLNTQVNEKVENYLRMRDSN